MEELPPWKGRLLLIFGGVLGLHRLYIRQIPEAFIYFSTFGVFLLGCLYDSFFFRQDIDNYNELVREYKDPQNKEKYKKGRMQTAQMRYVAFSFNRFLFSVLYGFWIGVLTWLAASVTFGWTDIDHVPFICVLSSGVTAGIYLIGQCGGQTRELSYIWLAAFSSSFLLIRIVHVTVFRALFIAAIIATVIGNRSARMRSIRRRHSLKHFVFWASLYCMLMCVIILGCSRKIMDKQITATRPGNFRETASVGSLIRDRFFDTKRVHSFFHGDPKIEYHSKSASDDADEYKNYEKSNGFWEKVWSGEMFDEITGAAHLTKIDWAELTTVFIIDIFRGESRVIDGKSTIEPFQWAAWRNYLIHKFDFEPLVSDDILKSQCKKWLSDNDSAEKANIFPIFEKHIIIFFQKRREKEYKDYAALATRKACASLMS
ncbi:unnamed protein product [Caenorhabditis bovis]|uniref:TM2 domain-containing protein n=1 Tax=Caenorhabditis bovis TaxID=2654633 RepID=A0A8S1F7G0_9PELO|nr:unnamed protein product [Caenorhabditis bovis]